MQSCSLLILFCLTKAASRSITAMLHSAKSPFLSVRRMKAELRAMEQEESSTPEGEKRRIRLLPDGIVLGQLLRLIWY